jgi:PAS domain-containing protein
MSNEDQNFINAQMLRLKAEEKLREEQKSADKKDTETDVKRLLHELQVHQIELEMQNEELHRINETAEAALKKYTMLYDFAPMGYFTLDSDGRICDLNFTGAEILGDRHFSLVNSNFKLYVSEDSQPVFNSFITKVFSGNTKESCEVWLGHNNNYITHVYMEGIVTGEEQECLLAVVDIKGLSSTIIK